MINLNFIVIFIVSALQKQHLAHPCVERLKGASDVVFRCNRRQVETMAASSSCQLELFYPVDEVGPSVVSRHRLNDKCLVFKCNEASAEEVRKQNFKACCGWSNAEIDRACFFLMDRQRQASVCELIHIETKWNSKTCFDQATGGCCSNS